MGGKLPEWYLLLDEFPDVTKVYTGDEAWKFVNRFVPEPDHMFIKQLLDSAGLEEYDAWECLKVFGKRNVRMDVYLYEEIPEGAIIYDEMFKR
jgi:hypothetical protein